jgi:hypothetical protein
MPAVAVSFVSELDWETTAVVEFARQRAHERLRRAALSYSVEYTHVRIGGNRGLEYVSADGTEETLPKVVGELVNVVEELAESGPTDAEIATMHEARSHFRDHPGNVIGYVESAGRMRLLDQSVPTPEEVDDIWASHTASSLHDAFRKLMPTIHVIAPELVSGQLSGWTTPSEWSTDRVEGTIHRPIHARERGMLIVGVEGVSWTPDDERCRTIRWGDVDTCFTFDDGSRVILGVDGISVIVTPWDWQGGEALTAFVDLHVDPLALLRLGQGRTHFEDSERGGTTHVRWLGSIVGALHNYQPTELVIDTDGVFLLYRNPTMQQSSLQDLRTADRESLMGSNRRNRWIAEDEIEYVELRTSKLARVRKSKAVLTICTREGATIALTLRTDGHVKVAREQFPMLLGSRFRPSPLRASGS